MARPRKEDALDIPRRAVEETIRLMEERGDADVPLGVVARAVGCSAPALYGHFRNKQALLRAAHDEGFARLHAEKRAVAAQTGGDPLERLRQGGYAYLRFAAANPVLYRLMFAPPAAVELSEPPLETDIGRRTLGSLADSIRACQEAGYLPGVEAEACAFALWSSIHGAADLADQQRGPEPPCPDQQHGARQVVDTMMALVEATRSPSRP